MTNPTKTPKIGALVGMGPNSTAPFYHALINYARHYCSAQQNPDFPEIVMISIPTPCAVNHGTDYQTIMPKLLHGITLLNQCQVECVAIVCNSVHQYYEQLQAACDCPIIHIAQATLCALNQHLASPIALLATLYTIQAGIYQNQLRAQELPYHHSATLQDLVNHLIANLKAAPHSEQSRGA